MRYRIAIAIPILAASALLSGCGTNADFGRVRPTMYNDDVHAWMGPVTTREYGDPPWRHTLTDEERTEVAALTDSGTRLKEAVAAVAAAHGLRSRELYQAVLDARRG